SPIRWFYESVGGPHEQLEVKFCHNSSFQACVPTLPLPSRRLRLPCAEGECSLQCPCDSGEGTCEDDSDCVAPALCVEGNGPRHGKEPGESVCEDPNCATSASLLGCGFEGAPCGSRCSPQTPCSVGCPAGQVCGFGKGPLFGDTE